MTEHYPPTSTARVPEPPSVDVRQVTLITLGLLLLVCLVLTITWALQGGLARPVNVADERTDPGRIQERRAPTLDPEQSLHREEYEARQRELLTSYGWIDREAGIARIPVDRAIEIMLGNRRETP